MGDEAKMRSRPRTNTRRSLCLHLRVTPAERALLVAAAEASSMMVGPWIRHHALRTVAGVSSPPGPVTPPAARHSPGKRKQTITVYLRDGECEAIVEHARACGLTASALIRLLVLGCEPIARRPVVRSAIAAVHRAGTILLRLSHPAGGASLTPDQMRAVGELRDKIHALRDALLRADAAGAPDLAG